MFEYGGGFVQDRSIYEDVDIFAKMHEEQGTMSADDYHTYYELFNAMVMTPYFPKPDVLIYLECDYDEVIDRIQQRGRDMEINTDPEYWRKLFKRYENWINNFNACPVVRLNINEYDIHEDLDSLIQSLIKLLKLLKHTDKWIQDNISNCRKLELIFVYFHKLFHILFTSILK